MASGHDHDKATVTWILPFCLITSVFIGIELAVFCSLGFAVGGLWLSPDLDINSRPLKRWGILQKLWWPYRKIIPHRSFFSHSPIIGTAIRITYLICLICLILWLLMPLKIFSSPLIIINKSYELFEEHLKYFFSIIFGIEASAWLHLLQDWNPLSKKR